MSGTSRTRDSCYNEIKMMSFRHICYMKGMFFPIFTLVLGFFFLFVPITDAETEAQIAEQEARLKTEYTELEKEIAEWQKVLDDTRKKANSLDGDIKILNAKIKEAEATIRAKNLAITNLSKDITAKNYKITELESQIEAGRQTLAELIRKTNELDSYTLPEVVFAKSNLSEFFSDFDAFFSIKRSLKEYFAFVRSAKANTELEKKKLDEKKNQETDAKYVVENQKKKVAQSEAEKKKLLAITKEEEKSYQQVLAERQARAAQIRAALFRLRDTEGIPFGQALEYANVAAAKTGIRPALILAILTQESDLGKNQGSCLLSSLETGNGVGKNPGTVFEQVMKAPRDTVPFENITKRLGRDWKLTPVSCPPGTKYVVGRGFGGGMGPSQFIPSTWELDGVKGRVGRALGVSPDSADPWDPAHSFIATSFYLSDLGAVAGSFTAERNAACRYYSGASCKSGRRPANVFYGDQVMAKAEEIQANIDFLKGV